MVEKQLELAKWLTKLKWCRNVFISDRNVINNVVAQIDDGKLMLTVWQQGMPGCPRLIIG